MIRASSSHASGNPVETGVPMLNAEQLVCSIYESELPVRRCIIYIGFCSL